MGILEQILVGVAISFISGLFANYNAKKKTVTKVIDLIGNNSIREIVKVVIRGIAKDMPEASNFDKLQEAIKQVQGFVPDMMLSDDLVKTLIESVYEELKLELKEV